MMTCYKLTSKYVKCQNDKKNRWKSMKIANIEREIIYIFWTTWGILLKFWGKMWIKIILKVTTNQGFTLYLEDTFFEKPQGGSQIDPLVVLGLRLTRWPLTFTLYKAVFKNKKRSGTSLLTLFSAWFLKKNIFIVIFY